MSRVFLTSFAATGALSIAIAATALPDPRPVAPIDPAGYPTDNQAVIELGQMLFYDPILSGNQNIACATCHHPRFGTGDGLALGLGEGGVGLGDERIVDMANMPHDHIPRNAPALFNLGHEFFEVMFHDGRVAADYDSIGGIRSPLGADVDVGAASVLATQAMFPVTSADEMAGQEVENEIAIATRMGNIAGDDGVWDLLSARLAANPEYRALFQEAFGVEGDALTFSLAGDALAAFINFEFRADDSPFDRYLRGEELMSQAAMDGMALFYGDLGCSGCHSGSFQTDQDFHATGLVQFGPGKAGPFEDHARDDGRYMVTGDPADLFAFRTPTLRNVTLSAPYGHTGAYAELDEFLVAHAAPRAAWDAYDPAATVMPVIAGQEPFAPVLDTELRDQIMAQVGFADRALSQSELAALMAFLGSLTDTTGIDGRLGIPASVPSGLPVPN